MKILIVAATGFELGGLLKKMESEGNKVSFFEYEFLGHQFFPLVTGVGGLHTAFALSRYPEIANIDLAINIGLCGAYEKALELASVVEIRKDRFGDLGVEESNGTFTDVYDLEIANPNRAPLKAGWLINDSPKYPSTLEKVTGLTLNKVSGTQVSINRIRSKYPAQVESMEGAAFLYACQSMDVDCICLRTISNYVEPRNRDNWKVNEALLNLNEELLKYLKKLNL